MGSYINEHGKLIFTGQDALKAGAYVLGRLRENRKLHYKTTFQDLPISIENRKGSVRRGTDPDGDEWETKMKVPYGYIRGTEGVDGDGLDTFIGPDENAAYAYIVHCNTPEGDKFDEDKVMLGFSSKKQAENCFHQHYDDPKFFGGIDEIPMWKFHEKVWVKKHTTRKLVASRAGASLQVPQSFFEKLDTFGRGTDQDMKKSILGHHPDIMVQPEVREGGPGSGPRKENEDTLSKLPSVVTVYHGTDSKNLGSIKKDGLRGKGGDHLYVTLNPADATGYGDKVVKFSVAKQSLGTYPGADTNEFRIKSGFIPGRGIRVHESWFKEHGVKGQKWGVRSGVKTLYHGTRRSVLKKILTKGLRQGRANFDISKKGVYLTNNRRLATKYGKYLNRSQSYKFAVIEVKVPRAIFKKQFLPDKEGQEGFRGKSYRYPGAIPKEAISSITEFIGHGKNIHTYDPETKKWSKKYV